MSTDCCPMHDLRGVTARTVTRLDRQTRDYAVSGGFLEVRNNTATLLADALEPAHEIDLERAEAAARRARERLETILEDDAFRLTDERAGLVQKLMARFRAFMVRVVQGAMDVLASNLLLMRIASYLVVAGALLFDELRHDAGLAGVDVPVARAPGGHAYFG